MVAVVVGLGSSMVAVVVELGHRWWHGCRVARASMVAVVVGLGHPWWHGCRTRFIHGGSGCRTRASMVAVVVGLGSSMVAWL